MFRTMAYNFTTGVAKGGDGTRWVRNVENRVASNCRAEPPTIMSSGAIDAHHSVGPSLPWRQSSKRTKSVKAGAKAKGGPQKKIK